MLNNYLYTALRWFRLLKHVCRLANYLCKYAKRVNAELLNDMHTRFIHSYARTHSFFTKSRFILSYFGTRWVCLFSSVPLDKHTR